MLVAQTNKVEQFGDDARNYFFRRVIQLSNGRATLANTVRDAAGKVLENHVNLATRLVSSFFSERAVTPGAKFYAALGLGVKQVNTTDQRTFTRTR